VTSFDPCGNKMKLRLIPLILNALLVVAHFLRSDSLFRMLLCLAAPGLLFIKKYWSLVVLQALFVAAVLIWLFALYDIIQQRLMEGQRWWPSAIILGLVAVFALYSGWLLETPQVKKHYPAS
jgi:hypothetical protein